LYAKEGTGGTTFWDIKTNRQINKQTNKQTDTGVG